MVLPGAHMQPAAYDGPLARLKVTASAVATALLERQVAFST